MGSRTLRFIEPGTFTRATRLHLRFLREPVHRVPHPRCRDAKRRRSRGRARGLPPRKKGTRPLYRAILCFSTGGETVTRDYRTSRALLLSGTRRTHFVCVNTSIARAHLVPRNRFDNIPSHSLGLRFTLVSSRLLYVFRDAAFSMWAAIAIELLNVITATRRPAAS